MDFRGHRHRRHEATLDLTPLIDVVFLLLIFFLVTATFAQSQAQSSVPVDLPEGATGQTVGADERITVHLQDDGTITVERAGDEPSTVPDVEQLRRILGELHLEEPGTPVYLRGDREVPYGRVMEVLDTARAAGFRQVYNVVYSTGE